MEELEKKYKNIKNLEKLKNIVKILYVQYKNKHQREIIIKKMNEKNFFIDYFNILDKRQIFRWGQEEVYNTFNSIINIEKKYWGILIAPTGFGKSFLHFLICGLYFKNNNKTIIIMSKRKEILKCLLVDNQTNY